MEIEKICKIQALFRGVATRNTLRKTKDDFARIFIELEGQENKHHLLESGLAMYPRFKENIDDNEENQRKITETIILQRINELEERLLLVNK